MDKTNEIYEALYKAQAILSNASKILSTGDKCDTVSTIDAALDYLEEIHTLLRSNEKG